MRRSHRRFRSAVDAVGRQKKSSVSVTPHLFGARARSLRRLDHGWSSITIASRGEAASDERGPGPTPQIIAPAGKFLGPAHSVDKAIAATFRVLGYFRRARRKNVNKGRPKAHPNRDPRDVQQLIIRDQNSRPQNGWLWPIDQAGHLVPFRQQPLQSAEFGANPFGAPTIHPPCASPPRERPQ
jgi:hypothetical protein